VIMSNPLSQILPAASNAVFRVTAVGSQPLAYQWLLNGAAIPGATNAQWTLSGLRSGDSGAYQVVVSNTVGVATSTVAQLTVTAPPVLGCLEASLRPGGLVIRWTGWGTLQGAPTPAGPYSDVSCADTCYTNSDMSTRAKFFRLRQ